MAPYSYGPPRALPPARNYLWPTPLRASRLTADPTLLTANPTEGQPFSRSALLTANTTHGEQADCGTSTTQDQHYLMPTLHRANCA